jgi:hypothetical protein
LSLPTSTEATLPAAHPTLGARQQHARKVVEGGSLKRFAGGAMLIIGILLMLCMTGVGVLVAIGGALQGDAATGVITAASFLCVGVAAGVLPTVVGGLLLRAGRKVEAHVEEVGVYTSGVLSRVGEDTTILHWGQVRAFKRSPAKGRISIISTDLPLLFFRLEGDDGTHIEVRGYPQLGPIGAAVEAETTRRRLATTREALARGEQVRFGDVALTPEGVTGFGLGGGLIRWDELQGFGLGKYNTFGAKQALNPILLKGPLFIEMPDAAAFVTVADEMRAAHGAG